MRNAALVFTMTLGVSVAACSSSTSPGGGSGGDGGSPPSCSCSVTYNGVSQTIDCGGQACVNGSTFTCSSTAQVSKGDVCTAPPPDSGSPDSSGGNDSGPAGCSLFTCTNTAGCGGIAPCMSTSTGTNYCYEQEGSPAQCSAGTTPVTRTTSNGPTTLCVPANCPQPDTFIP